MVTTIPPVAIDAPARTRPAWMTGRLARRLAAVLLALALIGPVVVAVDAPEAEALAYGFDRHSPGHVGAAHGWVTFSWNDVVRLGSTAALKATCQRVIGVPGPISSRPCGQIASWIWGRVDWRGGHNHGAWAEVGINGRFAYGTW